MYFSEVRTWTRTRVSYHRSQYIAKDLISSRKEAQTGVYLASKSMFTACYQGGLFQDLIYSQVPG